MPTEKTFEFDKALAELEDITSWFESGNVDLDAGLAKFERGMELAGQLKSHLAAVENRIEKIKHRFGANGDGGEGSADNPEPPVAEPEPASSDQTGLF